MKKLLAILMALALVLVNVAALAADPAADPVEPNTPAAQDDGYYHKGTEYDLAATESQSIKIQKVYTVSATDNWELPSDTLTFTQTSAKVTHGGVGADPGTVVITAESIKGGSTEDDLSYDVTIKLPSYAAVGVYYYTFSEANSGVAGVTYIEDPITLRVTVIQNQQENKLEVAGIAIRLNGAEGKDGDGYDASTKVDSFENTYEAGSLKVAKVVTGNMGDYGAPWTFTVKLTAPASTVVNAPIFYGENKTIAKGWSGDTEVTVILKHGESVQFDNIPAGVEYEITEEGANTDGYTTTPEGDSGTIAKEETKAATFTNDKEIPVDTGISMETVPYIVILALALIGTVVLFVRKREEV